MRCVQRAAGHADRDATNGAVRPGVVLAPSVLLACTTYRRDGARLTESLQESRRAILGLSECCGDALLQHLRTAEVIKLQIMLGNIQQRVLRHKANDLALDRHGAIACGLGAYELERALEWRPTKVGHVDRH